MEEQGGLNLFLFAGNNPIDNWDSVGLQWHYERDGKNRAVVWFDDPKDTVEQLAKLLRLDASNSSKWLKDEQGKKVHGKLEECKLYTVPNKFVVVLGWRAILSDGMGFTQQAMDVVQSFERLGFAGYFYDALNSPVSSSDVISAVQDDTWGVALFGHGKSDGKLVLKHRWNFYFGEILDYLDKDSFATSKPFGAVIAFFCYADKGGWSSLKTRNGSYFGGVGTQIMALHPSWTEWANEAAPAQRP